MQFLQVYPEAVFPWVESFKVYDKVTFSLISAILQPLLTGATPLRPQISRDAAGVVAVLIGTMLKKSPDVKAYMRSFKDPKALDVSMLQKLAEARKHLNQAKALQERILQGRGEGCILMHTYDQNMDRAAAADVQTNLDAAYRSIIPHETNYFATMPNINEPKNVCGELFQMFAHVISMCDDPRLGYGYIMAGIKLYCDDKRDKYRRTGNTVKIIIGLLGAGASACPAAAPASAAAVVIGSALVDHAVEHQSAHVEDSLSRVVGQISGLLGVADATFMNAYATAAGRGAGYV